MHYLRTLAGDPQAVTYAHCPALFEATAQAVHQHLLLDTHIRYIYMATQSVPGCIAGIQRAQLPYKITVICNGTSDEARTFLEDGQVDFVIGHNAEQTAGLALQTLYELLCHGTMPRERRLYRELTIYTRQMLCPEVVQ